jgi:parvulin-like peptidyl-prolyl isomerase
MSIKLTIPEEEIIQFLKISGQIPAILEAFATRRVIDEAIKTTQLEVSVTDMQQAADVFRQTNKLLRAEDTMRWLDQQGLSLNEFEEMIKFALLSAKIPDKLFADQVEAHFVSHQLDYVQVALYEIIFDDVDLAMELFYGLQEGELNFHALAHQYILDPELRRVGGYCGLVQRSQLKPEISAAVFASKPPQTLKPILTSKGAHLILVEELIEPQLDKQLRDQIVSTLFAAWLQEQVQQTELIAAINTPLME